MMIVLAVLFPAITLDAQGIIDGFFRGDGNLDVAMSYSVETGDEFWIGDQKIEGKPFGDIETRSLNLFVALGVSDRLEIVGSVPWIEATASGENAPPDTSDVQDISLYAKWKGPSWNLATGSVTLVPAIGFHAPLSDYVVESPIAIGHDATRFDGVLLAHWVGPSNVFADLGGGYSFRNKRVPNAVIARVKAGWFSERSYFDGWFDLVDSRGGHDIGQGPFQGTEVDESRIGATAFTRFTPAWGAAVGLAQTIDGRNTTNQTAWSLSLVWSGH